MRFYGLRIKNLYARYSHPEADADSLVLTPVADHVDRAYARAARQVHAGSAAEWVYH